MSEQLRSVALWTGVFLAFELPAHFGLAPWYTLSRTVWNGEEWWPPVGAIVAVFTVVLLGHLEAHWGVKYLIAVAIASAVLIASRAIEHLT